MGALRRLLQNIVFLSKEGKQVWLRSDIFRSLEPEPTT